MMTRRKSPPMKSRKTKTRRRRNARNQKKRRNQCLPKRKSSHQYSSFLPCLSHCHSTKEASSSIPNCCSIPDNAFLWQEFHSSVIKEEELTTPTTDKKSEAMPKKGSAETDERFLAVLHHLVTFW